MSTYFSKLKTGDRQRYVQKLLGLGFCIEDDPFSLLERKISGKSMGKCSSWLDDVRKWPSVDFGQIFSYLIETPGPYTMESMKAYRSLEAYNFFISGWIHTCFYKKSTTGHCIIAGKVNRSQAVTNTPHKAWIGIDTKNNNIDCAHCSCMAGYV